MTNDLEKQFFDTFGIEPIERKACNSFPCGNSRKSCENCNDYTIYKIEYPQITDRILLELFDILRTAYNIDFWSIDGDFVMDLRDKQASFTNIFYRTGGDLKESILSSLNLVVKQNFIGNDKIKHQVRTLFEEG